MAMRWQVTWITSLATTSSSGGVIALYAHDNGSCLETPGLCGRWGQVRDPRDRADVWNGERTGEDPERGIPTVPLNAAPPRQDAEAGEVEQPEKRERAR
uniref:Secreted protein n=1 Tax=Chenopodium quinoa TaxID=63459 RepID=A0A803MCU7_CHEQI